MIQEINAEDIGAKIKKLRGKRTQREVAEAIGVTPMAISQYEQGERVPADNIKIKLAQYFNKSVGEIFF
jgi:transcriptional regulator with XRE-family HTH domain